jgi:mono/diheme cytochrome c family protein
MPPPRRLVPLFLCALLLAPSASGAQRLSSGVVTRFDAEKAITLMRVRLPCFGCHIIDSTGSGGRIGPALTQVRDRRSADYIARVITDPQRTAPGTIMPRTPMPPATRALIVAYLVGSTGDSTIDRLSAPGGGGPPAASFRARGSGGDGAALYARFCSACHGAGGGGDGPNARFLAERPAAHKDARFMATRTDDRLFDAVYAGGYPLGRSASMPAFGQTLSRDEIWSLVRHMRTLCACSGPAWSTDGARAPAASDRGRRAP